MLAKGPLNPQSRRIEGLSDRNALLGMRDLSSLHCKAYWHAVADFPERKVALPVKALALRVCKIAQDQQIPLFPYLSFGRSEPEDWGMGFRLMHFRRELDEIELDLLEAMVQDSARVMHLSAERESRFLNPDLFVLSDWGQRLDAEELAALQDEETH